MTFFKGPAEQRADERRVKDIGPPANPAWWTPVRVEVMRALMRRSEIHVRMASMTPGREKTPRWRPHAIFMKTKHLFEGSSGGILTPQNVGPAIRNLIEWGFLRKAPTAVSQVEFTIKGWAWLAAEGHIEPAWLELIFERQDADRAKAWELCRKIKGSRKLHNLSTQFAGGLQEKVVADIMEPAPMTENMPFVEPPTEDELPGLPEFDEGTEQGIQSRAQDADFVQRTTLQLARTFHHGTIGALSKIEPKKVAEAIGKHLTPEEVIRGDLEMVRDQREGPRESYYSRLLVNRMSAAGDFKARSLADHTDGGVLGMRGESRITEGLIAQELRDEGLARHMPGSATLGEVHDRIVAESVMEMGQEHETSILDANTIMDNGKPYRRDEAIADVISHGEVWREALTHMRDNAAPATVDTDDVGYWQHQLTVLDRILLALDIASEPVPATPENIAKANKEWKAEDDKLPMVDWIDKRLGQYDYDDWVPKGNAALVAREAVFRHMRENPVGARVVMSEDQPFVQYDGFRLHVRQQDYTTFEGRPCQFIMSVDSDYDPQDTENIKAWFGEFISFGAAGMRGELVKRDDSLRRSYHYPAGSNVDHEVVGELEAIKVRSINPLWMVGMMFGSSFLALIMFLVFLNFLPGQS
ncbi:hypothetical protein POLUDNITSA_00970 [Brevundimonas phage vB_BpoS-Poludnitsa]|nr:hypothetical protein POLUDNITSA_00970 [Brevundimonas phage vB_BpoS-Poludnitsa]